MALAQTGMVLAHTSMALQGTTNAMTLHWRKLAWHWRCGDMALERKGHGTARRNEGNDVALANQGHVSVRITTLELPNP